MCSLLCVQHILIKFFQEMWDRFTHLFLIKFQSCCAYCVCVCGNLRGQVQHYEECIRALGPSSYAPAKFWCLHGCCSPSLADYVYSAASTLAPETVQFQCLSELLDQKQCWCQRIWSKIWPWCGLTVSLQDWNKHFSNFWTSFWTAHNWLKTVLRLWLLCQLLFVLVTWASKNCFVNDSTSEVRLFSHLCCIQTNCSCC